MEAKVNVNDAVKGLVVKVEVTGVRVFVLRIRVAQFFIWAAAKVLGCEIEVKGLGE
jgi:hypothetical protein